MPWPSSSAELLEVQERLGRAAPPLWEPPGRPLLVAGCYICFAPAEEGERAWAAASLLLGRRLLHTRVTSGVVSAPYQPGLLALREGELLASAILSLPERAQVLLANATGRDHPRRAGLALHLGAELDLPSVGVTDRPLGATGAPPAEQRGATSPLTSGGQVVGYWVRTRAGTRPVAAHAGWRTTPETAAQLVSACIRRARTPEPIRRARWTARMARAEEREREGRTAGQRPVEPKPPSPRPEGGSSSLSTSSASSIR